MRNNPDSPVPAAAPLSPLRIALKALLLFLVVNMAFAALDPLDWLGGVSLYNRVFPGRLRMPYGDVPARSYSVSVLNIPALLASHELSGLPKPPGEFRVILLGDSATWGFLLPADQTLAAQLNRFADRLPDGRLIRYYNLGYPVMSLTKDFLFLTEALKFEPDLIIWPLTLESLPRSKQLFPPLLQQNRAAVLALTGRYHLDLEAEAAGLAQRSLWERTLIGRRRDLADLLRLQLYGVLWAATGVDYDAAFEYAPPQADLPDDESFHGLLPAEWSSGQLALPVMDAAQRAAGATPILWVNEPMYISRGANSQIRYNSFYPRWAYDAYRELLAEQMRVNSWNYLDVWDRLPPSEFTNSPVHLTAAGTAALAGLIRPAALELAEQVAAP